MRIEGMILGDRHLGIVRDGRTLRGMARQGHIIWPVEIGGESHGFHPYVDYTGVVDGVKRDLPRNFTWKIPD